MNLSELDILKRWRNHAEYKRHLTELGLTSDLDTLDRMVSHIASCWFGLARTHMNELRAFSSLDEVARSAYSRAYYAGYSASKAVRFLENGTVSLRGDDHQKVGELPKPFPDRDRWADRLGVLYQDRLLADYDNWSYKPSAFQNSCPDAVETASEFIDASSVFVDAHYGIKV